MQREAQRQEALPSRFLLTNLQLFLEALKWLAFTVAINLVIVDLVWTGSTVARVILLQMSYRVVPFAIEPRGHLATKNFVDGLRE